MGKFATRLGSFGIVLTLVFSGCASPGKKTAIGAGGGAAVGAGVGALVGGGKGALIGAAAGGVLGGAVGNRLDKQANELKEVAETKRTADGILVNLKNDLLFKTGSATLTDAAKTQLNQIAAIFSKYPEDRVTVVGHTDDVGSAATNQTLSLQRAQAVRSVLLDGGLAASQIDTTGMGEAQPLVPNDSAAHRAKNRRVELKVIPTQA
jgi:outer membrane protein OmpA-like peptidoglycan-associated protein